MRRSSVITISLLVIVIICLTVALIVTNINSSPKNNVQGEQSANVENENNASDINEPEPSYISLDSEMVEKMYNIVKAGSDFYYIKGGSIEKVSNVTMQKSAYYSIGQYKLDDYNQENSIGRLKKEDMDNAIKEIFGDVSYTPETFLLDDGTKVEYREDENLYYCYKGQAGGGGQDFAIHAISKVMEYSDRYEVIEKYLYSVPNDVFDDNKNFVGQVRNIKNWNSYFSENVGKYIDKWSNVLTAYDDYGTYEELVANVEDKPLFTNEIRSENFLKLLSKYYDQATEYKHTFMKNSDGTFYWLKSEIVK